MLGLRIRGLGASELTKIAVGKSDVVKDLGGLVTHAERSVAFEAAMKRLERATHITANAGDGAEVLVDHRERFGIVDRLRGDSRLGVHRFGPVEIASRLVDNRDHVEGLRDRRG